MKGKIVSLVTLAGEYIGKYMHENNGNITLENPRMLVNAPDGKVGFASEENPDGTRSMKFDYDILFNPHETDLDNKEFIDYIGDILLELLEEKLKDGTAIKDWKYNNI